MLSIYYVTAAAKGRAHSGCSSRRRLPHWQAHFLFPFSLHRKPQVDHIFPIISYLRFTFKRESALRLGGTSLDDKDITVLDDVFLTLGHHLALRLDLGFVAKLLERAKVVDNGLDEGLLKVAVDNTGGLRSLGSGTDGPLTNLVRAACEEAAELQSLAHLQNDLGQDGLGTDVLALLGNLGVGLEAGEALLETDREGDDRVASSMLLNPFDDLGKVLVLLADVVSLGQVDEEDDGLSGQEEQRVDNLNLDSTALAAVCNKRCAAQKRDGSRVFFRIEFITVHLEAL